jgi:uncharacterized protein YkwD
MGKTVAIVVIAVAALFSIPVAIAVYTDPQARADLLNKINVSSPAPVEVIDQPMDIAKIEREIHTLVNAERTKAGLSAFNWDSELGAIARDHAKNMANFDFVDHRDQNGRSSPQRYFAADYACPYGAPENIYYYGAEAKDFAKRAVNNWMDSPLHRENILTAQLRNEGIGVAIGEHGMYATQNFC